MSSDLTGGDEPTPRVIDNSAMHVGEAKLEVVSDTPPTAWDRVGEHVPSGACPPTLVRYLSKPIDVATDLEADEEPWGSYWRGQVAAVGCIRAYQRDIVALMSSRSADAALAAFPGASEIERSSARKAGRLDGAPTGYYVEPSGYLEGSWEHAPPVGTSDSDDVAICVERLLSSYVAYAGRSLSGIARARHYASGFSIVRVDKQKGWPGFTSGGDTGDLTLGALGKLSRFFCDVGIDEGIQWVSKRAPEWGRMPYCVQYTRRQGGRKPVEVWAFDPYANGPVVKYTVTNYYPKIRDVWAFPATLAWPARPAVGSLFGCLKSVPWHPASVQETVDFLKIADSLGLSVYSLDYAGFDKSVSNSWLRGFTQGATRAARLAVSIASVAGLGSGDDVSLLEAVLRHAETAPILAPSHAPGSPAYVYHRNRAVVSGTPFTTLQGSTINATALVRAYAKLKSIDFDEALAQVGVTWAYATAGDDTLLALPAGMDPLSFMDALKADGFAIEFMPGINFLARTYGRDAHGRWSCVPCVATYARNSLFKERANRAEHPVVAAIGVAAANIELNAPAHGSPHPLRHAFSRLVRTIAPPFVASALNWTPADLVHWTNKATAERLNQRDISSLIDTSRDWQTDFETDAGPGAQSSKVERLLARRTRALPELAGLGSLNFDTPDAALEHLITRGGRVAG